MQKVGIPVPKNSAVRGNPVKLTAEEFKKLLGKLKAERLGKHLNFFFRAPRVRRL